MKAVIDTNVFVSGIFWKGPPFKILEAWKNRKFTLVLSVEIFEEYRRILDELSLKYPSVDTPKILETVTFHAEFVTSKPFPKPICSDPDDDKFLSVAMAAKADAIATGDKALLSLNGFNEINILKPAEFLKLL